jgi:tRNA (guanine-N7-)-methyltransferase
VINHDAIEVLQQQIPDHSLACVQLFFPDPWHKKRHHKRRILRNDFITAIQGKLVDGGEFHMATDWQDYAQHMQQEMAASPGFGLISEDRGERPLTKFEQRGLRLGHGVWDMVYKKTAG